MIGENVGKRGKLKSSYLQLLSTRAVTEVIEVAVRKLLYPNPGKLTCSGNLKSPGLSECVSSRDIEQGGRESLTFEAVGVKPRVLPVGALGERPDPRGAPRPARGLRLGHEVAEGLLGRVELHGAVAGVVVLAVHPVGVQAPVLVRHELGHCERKFVT